MPASNPLLIDCLEASHWERDRFLELRQGGVGCVHITLAVWETARETLTKIGHWNR
jgi:membrane dipeptidase